MVILDGKYSRREEPAPDEPIEMSKTRMIRSQRRKIALITAAEPSEWVSCKTISGNLKQAYARVPGIQVQEFRLTSELQERSAVSLIRAVRAFAPEQISLIDHLPHPKVFFLAFAKHWATPRWPVFNVHVYGDFFFTANTGSNWRRSYSDVTSDGFALHDASGSFYVA